MTLERLITVRRDDPQCRASNLKSLSLKKGTSNRDKLGLDASKRGNNIKRSSISAEYACLY